MSDWWTQPSGPYVVAFPNGEARTFDTRAHLMDALDAMTDHDRCAAVVSAPHRAYGTRHDTADYVWEALGQNEGRP